VKALDEKILSGVALDVIKNEEKIMQAKKDGDAIKNHTLLFRDNVVYTPLISPL
jgi:lactate dehydrogenase-like 2-hydroxyacid dehydrogenase